MPEMTVSDTSPLFYLHRLALLDILSTLYGVITIPEAVANELEQGRSQGEDVPRLDAYPWINILKVNPPQYLNLIIDLGKGESEVLW